MAASSTCHFLDLPVELHLLIFDYCTPSGCITVSSIDEDENEDRNYGITKERIKLPSKQSERVPGLPVGRVPRVKHAFDRELLEDPARGQAKAQEKAQREEAQSMVHDLYSSSDYHGVEPEKFTFQLRGKRSTSQAETRMEGRYARTSGSSNGHLSHRMEHACLLKDPLSSTHGSDQSRNDDAHRSFPQSRPDEDSRSKQTLDEPDRYLCMAIPALHLTCRQIRHELIEHRPHLTSHPHNKRKLDVFLSFPDGVCIAAHRYPHMLKIARSINITGVFDMSQLPDPEPKPKDASAASGLRGGTNQLKTGELSNHGAEQMAVETLEVGLAAVQIKALEIVTNIAVGLYATRAAEAAHEADKAAQAQLSSRKNSTASTSSSHTSPAISRQSRSDMMDLDQTSIVSRTSSARSSSEGPREPLPGERLTIDPPSTSNGPPLPTSELLRAQGHAYGPLLNIRIFHPNEPAQHPFHDIFHGPAHVMPSVWCPWTTGEDFPAHLTHLDRPRRPLRGAGGVLLPRPQLRPSRTHDNPYSQIWTHSLSPGPAALKNIYGGDIKLAVARGRFGTGVEVVGKCNFGLGRHLSSHWPRLDGEEGRAVGGVRGWLCPESWRDGTGLDTAVAGWAAPGCG